MSRRVRKLILLTVGLPCSIVLFLSALGNWAFDGSIQTSLDPQYIPTAEALVENPLPVPHFLQISPYPGSMIAEGEMIYAGIYSARLSVSSRDVGSWTRLILNNVRMAHIKDVTVAYGGPLMPPNQTIEPQFYFDPQLQPGYHLIEIRIGTSITDLLNPAAARSYTWAYRVE